MTDAAVASVSAEASVQLGRPADEKAWALKRDWTDVDFQGGEEQNRALLQEFEDVLVSSLRASARRVQGDEAALQGAAASGHDEAERTMDIVLRPDAAASRELSEEVRSRVFADVAVLGSALDIVGAYLKNYEVDKAAAVVDTILPHCRRRGGLWLIKALNQLAVVRIKQARPDDSLAALREVERTVRDGGLSPESGDEAWEFWETMYRNFGWVHSTLGQQEEAIGYIQRAVDVKSRVGKGASWFDHWDLGRMSAAQALKRNEAARIREAQEVVTKALWMHRDAEPSDLVMRAKIWHSAGECSFALGHLAETAELGDREVNENSNRPCAGAEGKKHYRKALKCFRESHKLFAKTAGARSPLTGVEAQALSWTLLKLAEDAEAKGFLLEALEALSVQQNGWGDAADREAAAPALGQAVRLADAVMDAHRRTGDREGLEKYFEVIDRLCKGACGRLQACKDRVDASLYERLVSACSMIMVASGTEEGVRRSQELLRRFLWKQPDTPQAQLCSELLLSLRDGGAGPCAPGGPARDAQAGPGVQAFLQALAGSGAART